MTLLLFKSKIMKISDFWGQNQFEVRIFFFRNFYFLISNSFNNAKTHLNQKEKKV